MDAAQFDVNVAMEERHWWFTARREIMRAIVEQLAPPQTGKTVVDIGCGTGANIASLADAYRAIGTDASADAIERAERRFPQAEFHCTTDAAQLAGFVSQADVVTCMDVLEHVPDDFSLLSSLLAAARPGTHFLLTVPALLSLWSGHDESLAHYRRYDAERFARVWQGLPVECRMLSYFNARLYPLVRAIRNTNALLGRTSGVQGTDLKVPAAPLNRTLHGIFLGEKPRLLRLLQQNSAKGYRRGVSLIAVLRRENGEIAVRNKPADISPDYYDPVARKYLT
jgi:SAM-dependent methyltransferase